MSKVKTIKNEYGEVIRVKLDGETIMVHHTDCTRKYITFNELCLKYVLDAPEIILIWNTVKELYLPIILKDIADAKIKELETV